MGNRAILQSGKGFTIEEVTDFAGRWDQIETLILGLIEYHQPWDSRRLREDWAPRMRDFMASQGVTLLAHDASGEAIGLINGNVTADFGIFDEVVGHIHNAFVVGDERRNGVGRALLRQFEAWCRNRGATEIRLEVMDGNDLGRAFWGKSGYAVTMHEMRKSLESSS